MEPDYNSLESLFQLVHAVKRQLHQAAERLDLDLSPMHIRVIKVIDRKGPCTAMDITGFLGRDKAQITRLLNLLIRKELVSREPNPGDKRSHYLQLTTSGQAMAGKLADLETEILARMTDNLSPQELQEFRRIAGIMADNLRIRQGCPADPGMD